MKNSLWMSQTAGYLYIATGGLAIISLAAADLYLGFVAGVFSSEFTSFTAAPYFLVPFLTVPLVGLSTISILAGLTALARRKR